MNTYELKHWKLKQDVIGIDEAGRGPMAGPLVVCGVILPHHYQHPLINDSKQLSLKQRQACFIDILCDAKRIMIDVVSVDVIDTLNIYQATKKSMEAIINHNHVAALVDAMVCEGDVEIQSIVKGDQQSISIAAASIVAKMIRDNIMIAYDQIYPHYGFKNHKGYPTQKHKQAMAEHGLSPIHRRSFTFKSK